jgi:hypothetical protein
MTKMTPQNVCLTRDSLYRVAAEQRKHASVTYSFVQRDPRFSSAATGHTHRLSNNVKLLEMLLMTNEWSTEMSWPVTDRAL